MTNLLLFMINMWQFCQPQCTLQLLCHQFVSCIYYLSLYTLLFMQTHKQKSNKLEKRESWTVQDRFKQLHLDNHSEPDTCSDKPSSYNDQYYYFPKHLSFHLNHPVHERPDVDLAQWAQRSQWVSMKLNFCNFSVIYACKVSGLI